MQCNSFHFPIIGDGCPLPSPAPPLQAPSVEFTLCNVCNDQDVGGCDLQVQQPSLTSASCLSSLRWFPLVLKLVITQMFLKTVVCNMPTFLISLFSPVAPSIHEMKSHGVVPGRTALLRCEAAAVPSPTFEWFKGEKRWAQFDCLSCLSWNVLAALPSCQLRTYSIAQ